MSNTLEQVYQDFAMSKYANPAERVAALAREVARLRDQLNPPAEQPLSAGQQQALERQRRLVATLPQTFEDAEALRAGHRELWRVDLPDGAYTQLPGDPPGPAELRRVQNGIVYDVQPRTGRLLPAHKPNMNIPGGATDAIGVKGRLPWDAQPGCHACGRAVGAPCSEPEGCRNPPNPPGAGACPECNGAGEFESALHNEKCEACAGTGKAGVQRTWR